MCDLVPAAERGPPTGALEPGIGSFVEALSRRGYRAVTIRYKRRTAARFARFSFLSPVSWVAFGWLLLGEEVGPGVLVAAVLVAAGIVLINRPRPAGSGVTSREAGRAG